MPRKFRFILRKNHEKKRKISACRNAALVQATENPEMTVSLPIEIFESSQATSLQSLKKGLHSGNLLQENGIIIMKIVIIAIM